MFDVRPAIASDPSPQAPPVRSLIGRLGWIFAVLTILVHVAYMAMNDALSLGALIAPLLLVLGFLSVPAILRHGGSFNLAVALLLTFLLAAMLGLALTSGGLGSAFLILLPALPILGILLAGSSFARPAGLAALIGLALVGVQQFARGLPSGQARWELHLAYAVAIAFVIFQVVYLTDFYERQLDRLRGKLRAAATRDPLTALANRGSIDDALAIEHHRLARYPDSCLSLVLFDIDHFGDYNEANGHQAGDQVLKRLAETAQQRVRRAPDVLGRYGDDEMLAVLPATSAADAAILADCIRRDIEALALPHAASPHGVVTVSLGVVAEDASDRGSIDSLLTDVDQALGQAKLDGRNCVVSAVRAPDPGP